MSFSNERYSPGHIVVLTKFWAEGDSIPDGWTPVGTFIEKRIAEIERLRDKVDALQKFKDFVHARLDAAGIEKDPPGEHRDAGCRIGQRLDLVLGASPSCATPDEKFTLPPARLLVIAERHISLLCDEVLTTEQKANQPGLAQLLTELRSTVEADGSSRVPVEDLQACANAVMRLEMALTEIVATRIKRDGKHIYNGTNHHIAVLIAEQALTAETSGEQRLASVPRCKHGSYLEDGCPDCTAERIP